MLNIGMNAPGKKWLLCRIDDNGNRFPVERFATREQAEEARRRFEEKGHKQTYLINKTQ